MTTIANGTGASIKALSIGGGRTVVVPSWVETDAMRAERRRLVAGRFFLVSTRGGGLGERLRCRRCRGKHAYLTRYCLEQPFAGLLGSLWAYVHTASVVDRRDLDPGEAARLDAIRAVFRSGHGAGPSADLIGSHPETARALRQSMGDRASGAHGQEIDVGAVAVGAIERIEKPDAQRLLDRINTRAALYGYPKLSVEGLVTH